MKQNKMLGNNKMISFYFVPIMIIFSHCSSTNKKVDCQGSIEGFISAQVDNKQRGASLMEIKLPKLKMGNRRNKDYFNLGIEAFDNRTASYEIDGTLITLFDSSDEGIYSITLKTENKESLFTLKLKSSIIKNIKFIGMGEDENFYFIVEQQSSCNKIYITRNYAMFFSEY